MIKPKIWYKSILSIWIRSSDFPEKLKNHVINDLDLDLEKVLKNSNFNFFVLFELLSLYSTKKIHKTWFLSNLNNLSPQSSFIAIITIKGVGLHNNCIQKKIFRIDEKNVHRMKGR